VPLNGQCTAPSAANEAPDRFGALRPFRINKTFLLSRRERGTEGEDRARSRREREEGVRREIRRPMGLNRQTVKRLKAA